jgi:hypothetical protein
MKNLTPFMKTIILFFIILLAASCGSQSTKSKDNLSQNERHLCDSLKIDTTIVADLRQHSAAILEPFHYSLGRQINTDGTETELDPIHLQGLVFKETAENTENLLEKLQGNFKTKGYSLFTIDRNYGISDKPDAMAILKTTDKYEILSQIKTDGINYDIDTDSLIKIIRTFDNKYSLDLVGASGDWCEFKIEKEPADWLTFAKEAYEVCPDIVDQGSGSVEALADEMKKTKRLYFWWD